MFRVSRLPGFPRLAVPLPPLFDSDLLRPLVAFRLLFDLPRQERLELVRGDPDPPPRHLFLELPPEPALELRLIAGTEPKQRCLAIHVYRSSRHSCSERRSWREHRVRRGPPERFSGDPPPGSFRFRSSPPVGRWCSLAGCRAPPAGAAVVNRVARWFCVCLRARARSDFSGSETETRRTPSWRLRSLDPRMGVASTYRRGTTSVSCCSTAVATDTLSVTRVYTTCLCYQVQQTSRVRPTALNCKNEPELRVGGPQL